MPIGSDDADVIETTNENEGRKRTAYKDRDGKRQGPITSFELEEQGLIPTLSLSLSDVDKRIEAESKRLRDIRKEIDSLTLIGLSGSVITKLETRAKELVEEIPKLKEQRQQMMRDSQTNDSQQCESAAASSSIDVDETPQSVPQHETASPPNNSKHNGLITTLTQEELEEQGLAPTLSLQTSDIDRRIETERRNLLEVQKEIKSLKSIGLSGDIIEKLVSREKELLEELPKLRKQRRQLTTNNQRDNTDLVGLDDGNAVCARAQTDIVDELVHVNDENSYLTKAANTTKLIEDITKKMAVTDTNSPSYDALQKEVVQLQSEVAAYNEEAHRRRAMNFDRSVNNDIAHGFQTPFGDATHITVERTKKTPPHQRAPRKPTAIPKAPLKATPPPPSPPPPPQDTTNITDTESDHNVNIDAVSVMDSGSDDAPPATKPKPKAKKLTKKKPSPDIVSVMDSDSEEEPKKRQKVKKAPQVKLTSMSAFKKALNKKGGRQVGNKSQLVKDFESDSCESAESGGSSASLASIDAMLAEAGIGDTTGSNSPETSRDNTTKKPSEDGTDPMQGHVNRFAKEYFKLVGHNVVDDGCPHSYKHRQKRTEIAKEKVLTAARMARNIKKRSAKAILETNKSEDEESLSPDEDHSTMDDDDEEEVVFSSSTGNASEKLRLSSWVWDSLFKYQQTCVKWLWELHTQQVGGIVGDEMGLGKTVQICSFLSGIHRSGLLRRPALIACPVTLMKQWVREFHKWAPDIRCVVMHSSGSFQGTREALIKSIDATSTVVITTYHAISQDIVMLAQYGFQYIILDEGHMIRNHKSIAAQTVKQFPTPHRLVLTGSPLQNRLTELWALFDFIYPGKLGDLSTFKKVFEAPINTAGFTFAQPSQVTLAYKMCLKLRDLTAPYLLRRLKSDVLELPEKTETVLFCKLALPQIIAYVEFLKSDAMKDVMARQTNSQNARYRRQDRAYAAPAKFDEENQAILDARSNPLNCIHILRKICNYPGLYKDVETELNISTSGKLKVVAHLLPKWKSEGHKCLIFSQTRAMLDILEYMMRVKYNYGYIRIDGTTSVADRLPLIDRYNKDPSVFVAILTPKVGGVGLNLTGANRILIYDPDWNPITDIQARERAWRVGQKRDVVIYRLVTSGTIEEQIYKRQVFKAHLTHKVLNDPQNSKVFESSDMKTMFTLGTEYKDIYKQYKNKLSDSVELLDEDDNPIINQQDIVSTDVGYSIRKSGEMDDDDDLNKFFKPEPVKLPSERARAMVSQPTSGPSSSQRRTVKIASAGPAMQKRPNVTISATGETRSAGAPDDIQNTQMLMDVIDKKRVPGSLPVADTQADAEAQWVADQAEAEIRKSGMPIMKKMKWAGHTTMSSVRSSRQQLETPKRKNSERDRPPSNAIKESKLLDVHHDIIARGSRSQMTQQIEAEKAAEIEKRNRTQARAQVMTIAPPPPTQPKPEVQSRRSATGFKAPVPKQRDPDDELTKRKSYSRNLQLVRPDGKSIPLSQPTSRPQQTPSLPSSQLQQQSQLDPSLTRGIPIVDDRIPIPDLEDQIRLCIGPQELTSQDIASCFTDIIGDGAGQISQLDFRKRLSKIAYFQKGPKTWRLRNNQHLL